MMSQPSAEREPFPIVHPADLERRIVDFLTSRTEGTTALEAVKTVGAREVGPILESVRRGDRSGAVLPVEVLPRPMPEGLALRRYWVEEMAPETIAGVPEGEMLIASRTETLLQVFHRAPELLPRLAVLPEDDSTRGGDSAPEGSEEEKSETERPEKAGPGSGNVAEGAPASDGAGFQLLPGLGPGIWCLIEREVKEPREAPTIDRRDDPEEVVRYRALGGYVETLRECGGEYPCGDVRSRGFNLVIDAFAYFPGARKTVRHRMYGPEGFARDLGRRMARLMSRAPGRGVPADFPGLPR